MRWRALGLIYLFTSAEEASGRSRLKTITVALMGRIVSELQDANGRATQTQIILLHGHASGEHKRLPTTLALSSDHEQQ
ncbi:hypothetical protein R3P38DRAFT_3071817 [Favolaschia claudopus]|uniref:Secreted protein n=1 Tax=Favolaschia claudopus TaxID=2862362 RepID=A0AAV9ZZB3_9AGAR